MPVNTWRIMLGTLVVGLCGLVVMADDCEKRQSVPAASRRPRPAITTNTATEPPLVTVACDHPIAPTPPTTTQFVPVVIQIEESLPPPVAPPPATPTPAPQAVLPPPPPPLSAPSPWAPAPQIELPAPPRVPVVAPPAAAPPAPVPPPYPPAIEVTPPPTPYTIVSRPMQPVEPEPAPMPSEVRQITVVDPPPIPRAAQTQQVPVPMTTPPPMYFPAPAPQQARTVSSSKPVKTPATGPYKLYLRTGTGRSRFELRDGDEVILKAYCDRVDMQSSGEGTSQLTNLSAHGKVHVIGAGVSGYCDTLMLVPARGEVILKGNVRLNCKRGSGATEVVAEKAQFQLYKLVENCQPTTTTAPATSTALPTSYTPPR